MERGSHSLTACSSSLMIIFVKVNLSSSSSSFRLGPGLLKLRTVLPGDSLISPPDDDAERISRANVAYCKFCTPPCCYYWGPSLVSSVTTPYIISFSCCDMLLMPLLSASSCSSLSYMDGILATGNFVFSSSPLMNISWVLHFFGSIIN